MHALLALGLARIFETLIQNVLERAGRRQRAKSCDKLPVWCPARAKNLRSLCLVGGGRVLLVGSGTQGWCV